MSSKGSPSLDPVIEKGISDMENLKKTLERIVDAKLGVGQDRKDETVDDRIRRLEAVCRMLPDLLVGTSASVSRIVTAQCKVMMSFGVSSPKTTQPEEQGTADE